jgi:hypothetical protein
MEQNYTLDVSPGVESAPQDAAADDTRPFPTMHGESTVHRGE